MTPAHHGWDHMPFKSKAQRWKFAELLVTGKISPEVYEEWDRSTGKKKLPERVRPSSWRRRPGSGWCLEEPLSQ